MRIVLSLLILLCWPIMVQAEGKHCTHSAACNAFKGETGSRPTVPTPDLVCLVYPEIPAGSHIWLQLRKIEGDKRVPFEPFVTPRYHLAVGKYQTKFCIGRGLYEQADEVYLCAKFPDESQWHSARRRREFGGTGAVERATISRKLTMCLGKDCPAHFTD